MSLLLTAVAVSATTLAPAPACRWAEPGHDRYTGTVQAAVDRYADIPGAVRTALKQRMAAFRYDDIATIERDAIRGRHAYDSELRDMHFGTGRVCATVDRSGWARNQQERGLVYCESGHCLIVPTVCGNVSRVTRRASTAPSGGTGSPPGAVAAAPAAPLEPLQPLEPTLDGPGGPGMVPLAELVFPPIDTPAVVGDSPQTGTFAGTGAGPAAAPSTPLPAWSATPNRWGSGWVPNEVPTSPVPEPAPWALALAGALVLGWRRRHRG